MRKGISAKFSICCAFGALAACGGGGGGGGGFNSTPPPPPPPPPAPGYIDVFPNITQSTSFAVLGAQADTFDIPASQLVTNGFAVSFDAASDAYIIDLPSKDPGKFFAQSQDDRNWHGYIDGAGFTVLSVLKPSNPDIQLSHTSFGQFFEYDYDDGAPVGFVAFGTATLPAAIPTTGSATYDALVAGLTLDGDARVGGSATLEFNFGAGTLAGHLDPVLFPYSGGSFALGSYSFVNTVYGVGSTTFSGEFSHSNPLLTGAFNGLFTGPNAEELMARWSADFVHPGTQQTGEMFGIWVGKDGGP
jgi:hypothetical protein